MKRLSTFLLMAAISAARIGMGLFNGISGPTMLYLAENVDSSVSQLSYMFLGRSLGVFGGAVLGGVVKHITGPKFRHLLVLGIGLGFLGAATLIIPWIDRLWLLCIALTIGGIMYGYLDAGLQALILGVWGEKGSRAHIQIFHFTYCIGAFVAPVMAQPFLVMADSEGTATKRCPNEGNHPMNASTSVTGSPMILGAINVSTHRVETEASYNPVGFTYVIAALWMVSVGVFIVILSVLNTAGNAANAVRIKGYEPERRKEEKLRYIIWVFLPVIGYYFCSVTTENVFYNYIYAVSLCSDLGFSVTDASYMTSVTWLGLGVGRLTGILAAVYLKPRTIIVWSIVGSIFDSALMCLFGEHTIWLAWAISFAHGFTPSMMYPSGVSWLSQITNVSGFYMFIFSVGNCIGVLTMLPLAGYLFDSNPFSVLYQVFILAAVNAIFYALALLAGRRYLNKHRKKNNSASRIQQYESNGKLCETKLISRSSSDERETVGRHETSAKNGTVAYE